MGRASDAFAEHCRAWNAGEREAWLAIFSDDIVMEDPVGGVPKTGRSALATTWDRSHRTGRRWELQPRRVIECASEVAVDLVNAGVVDGRSVVVESIEIWRVDETGAVVSIRSFFASDPEVHDPWYLPADRQ